MKKMLLTIVLSIGLNWLTIAYAAETRYCTIRAEKFPCELILMIYGPDGKAVYWMIRINPDGTQELLYEADTPTEKRGLREVKEDE